MSGTVYGMTALSVCMLLIIYSCKSNNKWLFALSLSRLARKTKNPQMRTSLSKFESHKSQRKNSSASSWQSAFTQQVHFAVSDTSCVSLKSFFYSYTSPLKHLSPFSHISWPSVNITIISDGIGIPDSNYSIPPILLLSIPTLIKVLRRQNHQH